MEVVVSKAISSRMGWWYLRVPNKQQDTYTRNIHVHDEHIGNSASNMKFSNQE